MRTTPQLAALAAALLLGTARAAPAGFDTAATSTATADSNDWTTQAWDYIIVGAGPAGIIVADRLSETGKKTLLLEQGGPSYGITGGTEAPAWLNGTGLSRVDVPGLYNTIFATGSSTLCNGRYAAYGGCTIGGSSAINAGLYFAPPASDWDVFHPAGWNSADVASAVARLLARQPALATPSADGKRYAQSGFDAVREWIVEGAGYAEVDLNAQADRKTAVFGRTLYDYEGGQRGGPVTTYLQTARARANFALRSGVTVRRAARTGATATGVVVRVDGTDADVTVPLSATGRVIFSGGALFSPSLLMHSGIGPADELARLHAAGALDAELAPQQWLNNSAVGADLFDNPNTFIVLSSPKVESYVYSYTDPIPADRDLYLKERSGPYASAGQTSAFFTYISHADGTAPSGLQGTVGSAGAFGFTNSSSIVLNVYGTSGMLTTGSVVLNQVAGASAKFIPGPSSGMYYGDAKGRDADDVAQFIFDIFGALDKSKSGLVPLNIPKGATKEDIKTYITTPSEYAVGSVNHWSSSCRIGKCVDSSTRVIGMDNLHVVDASILAPLTVNPQFGVMVAGERGAELIKGLALK